MKGFLRVYDDGNEIKSKLHWSVIHDNYLNFYNDKKTRDPSSIINLNGCNVCTVFNDKYKTNLIQIKTPHKKTILLIPDNTVEYEKWENCLKYLSLQNTEDPRSTKVTSMPKNSYQPNVEYINDKRSKTLPFPEDQYQRNYPTSPVPMDDVIYQNQIPNEYVDRKRYEKQNAAKTRQREWDDDEPSRYRRKSADNRRPSTPTNDNENYQYSRDPRNNVDTYPSHMRNRDIGTVKEDPMMSDEEVLETKTLKELRKKYPISDKTKRWSIAASDIVGKSNDELFIMLIQLNREKSHMDIWKETLDNQLKEIDDVLKNANDDEDRDELENSRANVIDQLNEMDYMINLAHPLISFLESVVQMSDVYRGDNQTFHVVYHKTPPTGKEDFSNIDFIRHNQEREVARLINENPNNQFLSSNSKVNSLKNSMRSEGPYGKENDPTIALNLKKSQKFIDREDELTEVLEDIESQLLELDPLKTNIEKFVENFSTDLVDSRDNQTPLFISSKSSVKNVKSQNPKEMKMHDLSMMPRRSTRKAPKSDMTASLNRSEKFSKHNTLTNQSLNRASPHGDYPTRYNRQMSVPKSASFSKRDSEDSNYPRKSNHDNIPSMKHNKLQNSLREPKSQNKYNTESRLQNQLRDLVNGDLKAPSGHERHSSNTEISDFQDGPLIKLNVNKYQNVHRPNRPPAIENDYAAEIRNSLSNSDFSVESSLINQRMHLNEFSGNNKSWKNPGNAKEGNKVSSKGLPNHNPKTEIKAECLIANLFSAPAKVEIKDRYHGGSISNDSDVNEQRSSRIRKKVAEESMGRYTENEIGQRNEREKMLLKNSELAHEVSRRSRKL